MKNTLNKDFNPNKKTKKRRWRIRILLILLIILLLLLGLRQCGNKKDSGENENNAIISGDIFPDKGDARDGHLPNMSEQDILVQMQKSADNSKFAFKINSEPVFKDGKSAGNFLIENPNYNIYPMSVRVYLDNSGKLGELIYDSGGLLPNQHIENAKLKKVLKAGTHSAIAYIYVYHPKTREYIGKQSANLNIIIKQ